MSHIAQQMLPDPQSTDCSGSHGAFSSFARLAWRGSLPIGNVSSIPAGHLPGGNNGHNSRMDEHKAREYHAKNLIRVRFNGKKIDFAKAIDIDPSIVSRWFMSGKHHKNIGEQSARQIEKNLDLPRNSLDRLGELPRIGRKPESHNLIAIQPPSPFPKQLRDRIDRLSPEQKLRLNGWIEAKIELIEQEANQASGKQPG